MKYKVNDIVLLYDEKQVLVLHIDEKNKNYTVSDIDNESDFGVVTESDIFMKITNI